MDLILQSKKEYFKKSDIIEVRISEYYKFIVTALIVSL